MIETPEQLHSKLRVEAWNRALNSFGYAYIFDKKAAKYGRYSNWLKVFGIVIPVTVGAMATGYGLDTAILKWTIAVSIPLSVIQLVISVFAVVYKWDDELAYAFEASQELATLSSSFKKLGNFPPKDFDDLEKQYELLNEKYSARIRQNAKHGIDEGELRQGMRYALREFQKTCAGCGEVPKSMESTDCHVCGNFKSNNIWTRMFGKLSSAT